MAETRETNEPMMEGQGRTRRDARASAWIRYGLAGLTTTLVCAALLGMILGGSSARAIWLAAGLAWLLQLIAFAVLVLVRDNPRFFMAGWLAGIALRFGALGLVAFWSTRQSRLPTEPLLLGLVGFMFLLLLLEPLYLKRGLETA